MIIVMMIKWTKMIVMTVTILMERRCNKKERRKRKLTIKRISRQERNKSKEKNKDHFSKGCELI